MNYDEIVAGVLSIYSGKTSRNAFEDVFLRLYTENATFDDPIVSVRGIEDVRTQFYSLRQVFSSFDIIDDVSASFQDDKRVIIIDFTVEFVVVKVFSLCLKQFTRLELCPDTGRILHHRDLWCIPDSLLQYRIISSLYLMGKMFLGSVTSFFFRAIQPNRPPQKCE
eukprot:CFRG2759T1